VGTKVAFNLLTKMREDRSGRSTTAVGGGKSGGWTVQQERARGGGGHSDSDNVGGNVVARGAGG
jgi:hypothetical protein